MPGFTSMCREWLAMVVVNLFFIEGLWKSSYDKMTNTFERSDFLRNWNSVEYVFSTRGLESLPDDCWLSRDTRLWYFRLRAELQATDPPVETSWSWSLGSQKMTGLDKVRRPRFLKQSVGTRGVMIRNFLDPDPAASQSNGIQIISGINTGTWCQHH